MTHFEVTFEQWCEADLEQRCKWINESMFVKPETTKEIPAQEFVKQYMPQ